MKICKSCGKNKEFSYFGRSKNVKDGYENKCKECREKQRKKFIKFCLTCNSEFSTKRETTKYCSKKCLPQNQKNRITVECGYCHKEIEKTASMIERSNINYCSKKCLAKHQSLYFLGTNSPRYNKKELECPVCSKKFFRNKYEAEIYTVNYCSVECVNKDKSNRFRGKNHPRYNVSLSDEGRIRNRKYEEYFEWRELVYSRDNHTCQKCNDTSGGNLNAHHIYNYSEFPEMRTNIENGITFCKECHKKFHIIYGYHNNNKNQLKEFLK